MEKEKLSKEDTSFLASLGIRSIWPTNVSKKKIVNILRNDKKFQKELRGFLPG
ncbi:hypothetical protein HYT26_04855 [Candidatus Pacearchaeota archaeon]|nr:hypothetical protein [Candidatus Pacearchaeota archaeon]